MANPFAKQPVDWLRLQSIGEFMDELSVVRSSANQIVAEARSNMGKFHSEDYQLVTTVHG